MLEREACIALNMISGIGYIKFTALCEQFESPTNIFKQSAARLQEIHGIGEKLASKIASFDWERELTRELELVDKAGVEIITLYDEAYPEVLRNLYDPPLCLYVRGRLPKFPEYAVAIVGSRRISNYGARMTRQITSEAVAAGYTIVSGLAYGVDTIAHTVTVEQNGCTVAVLGGGLMRIHPQENVPLARRIVETGGAVISEFPMNYPVSRTSFPRRNRIVAGLSKMTIVTEAGVGSGALITARLALDNGRDLFAVPGHADNPQAQGCHQLIKEGAAGLIENFSDVLNAMGVGFGYLPTLAPGEENRAETTQANNLPLDDLPPQAREILNLLATWRELSLDQLADKINCETGELLSTLMMLEMKLLIEHDSSMFYRRITR